MGGENCKGGTFANSKVILRNKEKGGGAKSHVNIGTKTINLSTMGQDVVTDLRKCPAELEKR